MRTAVLVLCGLCFILTGCSRGVNLYTPPPAGTAKPAATATPPLLGGSSQPYLPLHDGNSWYYACYDASGKSVGSGEAQATGEAGTYALVLTLPASFGTYEELDLSEASFGVAISGFQAFTFGSTFQYVGYLPSDGGYISSEWPDGNGGTISHTGGGSTSQIVLPMGQTVNAVTFHDVDSKTGPINDISYAPGVGPVLISAGGPVINLAADSCILKSYILF